MSSHVASKDNVPDTPLQYEAFDGKLELICRACGKKGKYAVGRMFIDPQALQAALHHQGSYNEALFFSGYFRCKKCDSPGPWDVSEITKVRLMCLQLLTPRGGKSAPFHWGALRLHDGTPCHSAAEGEAHLLLQIDAAPDDYFLWNRLGNIFNSAEDLTRALPAFEKAIALNADDIESHHSLAEIYREREQWDESAAHYHQVLLRARHAPPRTKEKAPLLRSIVRHSLECLFGLYQGTSGRIEFLPTVDRVAAGADKEAVLYLKEYDLSKESSWEDLTDSYLGLKRPGSAGTRPVANHRLDPGDPVGRLGAPFSGRAPAGRNDPCPCGSGKKFKKCCAR